MMWPIFRPDDSQYASDTNTTHPADEVRREGAHIAQLAAGVVAANGTSDDPAAYGNAVAQHLLPDVLPYRTLPGPTSASWSRTVARSPTMLPRRCSPLS